MNTYNTCFCTPLSHLSGAICLLPLSYMASDSSWKVSSFSSLLTLVMLNKLRCHAHFWFPANQITWSWFLLEIHIFNDKQCRSRSVGFFRSQLIWIYTVCLDGMSCSAGEGLILSMLDKNFRRHHFEIVFLINKSWLFIWIVCQADELHEMSARLIFFKKKKKDHNVVCCSCDWHFKG